MDTNKHESKTANDAKAIKGHFSFFRAIRMFRGSASASFHSHYNAQGSRILRKIFGAQFFFLSPRGTSGERIEVRGFFKNKPPHPGPLLHPMEEREFGCDSVALGSFVFIRGSSL